MTPISLEEFLLRVQTLDGETLETEKRKLKFELQVTPEALLFVPQSSGKRRRERVEYVGKTLERYNVTRSFKPGDYSDVSRNASYVLSALRKVLDPKFYPSGTGDA